MTKGNHVFNAFDKVLVAIYQSIFEQLDRQAVADIKAVGGSGGDMAQAEARLSGRFVHSYRFLKEIRNHANIALIHDTQDDRTVVANDANSKEFGAAADRFSAAVKQWATGASNDDLMVIWRDLINKGTDPLAQETYVMQGSSAAGTPNSVEGRRKRCVDLGAFVKGELTNLVRSWLLAIRLDLKTLDIVAYDPKHSNDWKAHLSRV